MAKSTLGQLFWLRVYRLTNTSRLSYNFHRKTQHIFHYSSYFGCWAKNAQAVENQQIFAKSSVLQPYAHFHFSGTACAECADTLDVTDWAEAKCKGEYECILNFEADPIFATHDHICPGKRLYVATEYKVSEALLEPHYFSYYEKQVYSLEVKSTVSYQPHTAILF